MPRMRMKSSSSRKTGTSSKTKAPPHPFPELQGPFEESMTELERFEEIDVPSDAASRRTLLLDAPTYQRVIAGRWKQRPGERYHPLWKVVAQLSFGLHLLAENLAKSEEEVMQILQGHVDEIDLFLERTTEDFALAQDDIKERMRCLQLPLQHPKVFDRMLEDKAFRNSIVDGNEKIEHIVARTGFAMKDSLKDAQKGLDATNALAQYLDSLEASWARRTTEHEAIFEAMLENVEGWRGAFVDLHEQGDRLSDLLQQLTDVINQMQQRAGEVSRRLIRAQQRQGASPNDSKNITYIPRQSMSSTAGTRSATPDQPPRKPLPGVPDRASAQQLLPPNQRSGTAQSTRSVSSQHSSSLQTSRVASREGQHKPVRDSGAQSSTKSPRLVEVRRHSPYGTEALQRASNTPGGATRPDSNNHKPVELPGQVVEGAFQARPASNSAVFNPGLGITQDRVQSERFERRFSPISSAATNTAGVSIDASTLPLTPNSMVSNGDRPHDVARELPSDPVPRPLADPFSSSRPTIDSALGSPPTTPGWAKQTFDSADKERAITERTAFRSHPPNADLGSPPVLFQARFNAQSHHARVNGSIASSLGAPGPEIASSPVKTVRPTNMDGNNGKGSAPASMSPSKPAARPAGVAGKKEFVAELEGITPLTVRAPADAVKDARKTAREVTHEVVELEVPLQETNSSIVQKPSTLEQKFAAAIRKSFIATNIELPGVPIDGKPADKEVHESILAYNEGMNDIMVQLEQLGTTTADLSLGGEEVLLLLPATTYVAASGSRSRSRSRSPVMSATRDTGAEVIDTTQIDPAGGASDNSHPRPTPSRRASNESAASSQSQWRAFFKGQLSPTDFNTSTPHLPSKVAVAHKAIIELQRRGQDASPTLGWQWAPGTPEMESRSTKRVNS